MIAAQKFSYARGQAENAVSNSICENLPASILEKLSRNQMRNVLPDEQLERTRFDLRKKRQSLYLQLSSEYKKRDALFLNDYSQRQLQRKIKEEDKKITAIENQIDENLEGLKKAEEESSQKMQDLDLRFENEGEAEGVKFTRLLKNIFINEESYFSTELISFYKDDFSVLYTPSENASAAGYESSIFERETYGNGINCLITGEISGFGNYIAVNVTLYQYPGAKKMASYMEVGNMQELELMAVALAGQISPLLMNALPIELEFEITPSMAKDDMRLYIDDVLVNTEEDFFHQNAGMHFIEVSADGYETVSFSEFFAGSRKYHIEVSLQPKVTNELHLGLTKPVLGDVYINGEESSFQSPQKYIVQLNGSKALGEFIDVNDNTMFFYIPQELISEGNNIKIRPKPMDRDEYIDKRRKWAYGSYSAFVVSLIPAFYSFGNFYNQVKLYNDLNATSYETAVKWQNAYYITMGISIGAGIFWAYELVRYLLAANSVLPQKARPGDVVVKPVVLEDERNKWPSDATGEGSSVDDENGDNL